VSNIFYTGNTGGSTGPHLDFRVYNPSTGKYENPSKYAQMLTSNGAAFNAPVTSGFGMRTHPIHGDQRMHNGIDYATELDTAITVPGRFLSTWEDGGGGGIMSQYLVDTEDGQREFLLLHGSRQNEITGKGAVTDYSFTPGSAEEPGSLETDVTKGDEVASRSEAVERAKNYQNMSKAELNAEYDTLRGGDDINLAVEEGMKMHRAYFNKP